MASVSGEQLLRNAKIHKSEGLSRNQSSALKKLSLSRVSDYLGNLLSTVGTSMVKGFRAIKNLFSKTHKPMPTVIELKEMKSTFSIDFKDNGGDKAAESINYKDFKNIYTLGIGSMGDQPYESRGAFYRALSEKHGDTVFKPFEAMVDKLCVKLGSGDAAKGQEAFKNVVASISGSFDPKNGLYAELFSCLFRNISDAPDNLKDTSDKSPADILKFIDKQLRGIVGSRILGSSGSVNFVSQSISYKDFKDVYTLGIGSMGDHPYESRGEFYRVLSEKHGDTIFKPFEDMVDKLCVKLGSGDAAKGQEVFKNAVTSISGSFDSKNGLYAELFSCLFRNLSTAQDCLKDTSDKNSADILKFIDQ